MRLSGAFSDPLYPITGEIGFLEANQETVVEAFMAWRSGLGQRPVRRSISGGFEAGLRSLLPLTVPDRRRYVFFDHGGWTAFFDNGANGPDAASMASFLARTIKCRGLRAVSVADEPQAYGATILEVYGPEMTEFLNYIRTISAANDGGTWRFDTSGAPFPFEDTALYSRRRIRDRFTRDTLAQYLAELGVEAFRPGRYLAPVIVERTDREGPSLQRFTLAEARARFTARR